MNLEQDCSLLTRVRLGVRYSEQAEAALGVDGSGLDQDALLLPSTSSRADEPRARSGGTHTRRLSWGHEGTTPTPLRIPQLL